jgi:hypothetical protein
MPLQGFLKKPSSNIGLHPMLVSFALARLFKKPSSNIGLHPMLVSYALTGLFKKPVL